MRFFTGCHERTIDEKNRIQLPAQLRAGIDAERDGAGLYIILGEHHGTLSILTDRSFEELADRIETEFMRGPEAKRFELQFYSLASHVDIDKQGRFVLPDRLLKKARLNKDVVLVGQKHRIDIWNRGDYDRSLGIDWEGDAWPDWEDLLRTPPEELRRARSRDGGQASV